MVVIQQIDKIIELNQIKLVTRRKRNVLPTERKDPQYIN